MLRSDDPYLNDGAARQQALSGALGGSQAQPRATGARVRTANPRTQDFRDQNLNGTDDRDEGQRDPLTGYGGNTGVAGPAGGPQRQDVPPMQSGSDDAASQAAAGPPGLGTFASKLEGFDSGKLNSEHNSPKYAFGRVMSQFDPKGGITQAMLDQLNALGMGTVSGKIGGDKISIGGSIDPRFEGVTQFDIIRDLENGGGWQWGGLNGPAAQSAALGGAIGGSPFDGFVSQNRMDDPLGGIRSNNTQVGGDALQAIYQILNGVGPAGLQGLLKGLL